MLSPKQLDDIRCQAYMGIPTNFRDICKIYPLKLAEVVEMGITVYTGRLTLLLLTEVEIQKLMKEKSGVEVPLEDIHPLQYLLQSANNNDMFFLELQEIFTTFLKEEVLLIPELNAVLVNPNKPEDRRLITEDNFQEFQNILRIQNNKELKEPPPENETYGQRKMRLLRERVEEAKRKQAEKDGEEVQTSQLLEMASVFGIDIHECSVYAFQKSIKRSQAHEKWLSDIQLLCAGADAQSLKIKYWGETPD